MFQKVELFVLTQLFFFFFFTAVDLQTGQCSPPQNVTLVWRSGFVPWLTWNPPQHPMDNCTYDVFIKTNEVESDIYYSREQLFWSDRVVMEGGFLHTSVTAVCNGIASEPVVINSTDPELVSNLQCYIKSSNETHCSWDQDSPAADLRLFYELVNEDQTTNTDDNQASPLQECPSYTHTEGVRTGCCLQAKITQDVHMLFNGTLNNSPVKNTFKKELQARPPPLTWTVNKTVDKFIISWIPPDFGSNWKYTIKYTQCAETKFKIIDKKSSAELDLVSHCPYCIAIKAQLGTKQEMPWSGKKICYDADTDPNVLVYVAVIIPLMFAGLAAMTFMCCRKNKDKIFPKVPEPRDLLSDITNNNNNKSTVCNLYIPAEEEDNCEITLVVDPQNDKLCS